VIRAVGALLAAAVGSVLLVAAFCAVAQGLRRVLDDHWHHYGLDDPSECRRAP
jgi:hypothetical protein